MAEDIVIACPYHHCPPNWQWSVNRVAGKVQMVYRFDCCSFQLHVSGLPVPGIHEPLPEGWETRSNLPSRSGVVVPIRA